MKLKNTYCSLRELSFDKKPEVLLIYLEMEFAGSNQTFDLERSGLHLRPVLGLQYLVGAARDIGIEAIILDNRVLSFDEKMLAEFVEKNNIMLVGFYTSFAHTDVNSKFINNFKKFSDVIIISGGPGYTEHKQLLNAGADVVVRGEGEQTFKDILNRIKNSKKNNWSDINGIDYIENSEIKTSPNRALLDLDTISFPVRDNLNSPSVYNDYVLPAFKPPYITMFTNRGCPHHCTFCDSPNVWNNKVRHRSPDNVIAEIDDAINKWGIRFIDFVDDVFAISHLWAEEFCNKLIDKKYDLTYKALINPHTFGARQDKVISLLARSGCKNLGIGMQSAEMKTLIAIRRKLDTPESLIKAIKSCKKNDVLTFVSFIVGFPQDSINAANNITKLIKKAKPTLIDCYPLIFLKGTQLEQSLTKGDVLESHTYAKRFRDAVKVRQRFYLSPFNLLRFLFWLIRNNPSWLFYMLTQFNFIIRFIIGKKEDWLKAQDNKKRVKEILEKDSKDSLVAS